MDYAEYVLSGYGAVVAAIAGYALWVVRRGRSLARQVPPDQRRWGDAP